MRSKEAYEAGWWEAQRQKAVSPIAPAQQAEQEPLVRFCPGCGSIGEVDSKYRDCCLDGNKARRIPKDLAEHCSGLFDLAIGNTAPHQQSMQEPVAWKHDCAALCTNGVELWVDRCPHCGKPSASPQPVKQEPVWSVEECDRVVKTLRYIQGIAERGFGRAMREDETIEQFVLGYVKQLEAAPVRTKDLSDAQKVDNRPVIDALIEVFNVVMASESRDQALNEIEKLATSIRTGVLREKEKKSELY